MDRRKFLPVSKEDMKERGWDQLDFLLITGDAYVDHPSFGVAVIGRLLESEGFRVGVIAQPDWRETKDFKRLGRPRLGILITGGNIDSMVNHYTAAKKRRKTDAYSPGGQTGMRPDRATIVYANRAREAYKKVPIIIGGLEASLRRFAHYDYWQDSVRRSILVDARADLLLFGMAEKAMVEVAHALASGIGVEHIRWIYGTAFYTEDIADLEDYILLPSAEEVMADKAKYAEAFRIQYEEQDARRGKMLIQPHGDGYVVQNPPALPLTQEELDEVYSFPYARTYHPDYEKSGGVPAIKEVEFSLVSHRGCFGACSFCALTFHQGRIIQTRSHESILAEAKLLTEKPNFKGYIHDVGGPTANFRQRACVIQETRGACKHRECMFPEPCKNLIVSHEDYLSLLRKLRALPKVKKVFVRSGLRYDYLLLDPSDEFFRELCSHHISGQLKVAPEHVSPRVLAKMGKPGRAVYDKFVERYKRINRELGKEQYLVPYLMSSHPGSTLADAVALAEYVRDIGYNPEQVQDFIPTPGTLATCMYYTGLDPRTGEKVYVARSPHEKALQRALIQYRNPKNYDLVLEALQKAGRTDLIGYGPKCLILPPKGGLPGVAAKGKQIHKNHNPYGKKSPKGKTKKRNRTN